MERGSWDAQFFADFRIRRLKASVTTRWQPITLFFLPMKRPNLNLNFVSQCTRKERTHPSFTMSAHRSRPVRDLNEIWPANGRLSWKPQSGWEGTQEMGILSKVSFYFLLNFVVLVLIQWQTLLKELDVTESRHYIPHIFRWMRLFRADKHHQFYQDIASKS